MVGVTHDRANVDIAAPGDIRGAVDGTPLKKWHHSFPALEKSRAKIVIRVPPWMGPKLGVELKN